MLGSGIVDCCWKKLSKIPCSWHIGIVWVCPGTTNGPHAITTLRSFCPNESLNHLETQNFWVFLLPEKKRIRNVDNRSNKDVSLVVKSTGCQEVRTQEVREVRIDGPKGMVPSTLLFYTEWNQKRRGKKEVWLGLPWLRRNFFTVLDWRRLTQPWGKKVPQGRCSLARLLIPKGDERWLTSCSLGNGSLLRQSLCIIALQRIDWKWWIKKEGINQSVPWARRSAVQIKTADCILLAGDGTRWLGWAGSLQQFLTPRFFLFFGFQSNLNSNIKKKFFTNILNTNTFETWSITSPFLNCFTHPSFSQQGKNFQFRFVHHLESRGLLHGSKF